MNAGYLDDGVTRNYYGGGSVMHVISGGANNHAHGNILGAMLGSSQGSYSRGVDGQFEGTPEGDAGEWANNTHMPAGNITRAQEDAEWTFWQNKLASNGIVLGA